MSNFWLARCHSRAIDAAQVHKVRMTTSAFAGSSEPDLLTYRIRRPDDCLLSALQCYRSCALNTVLIVTSSVDHGLTGSPSNRTNVAEKKLLFDVVQANLSSTGHAADKNGHYRGSAFYLESKWVVLRTARGSAKDTRLSISASLNTALVAADMEAVQSDVPLCWLRALFWSTKRINFCYAP